LLFLLPLLAAYEIGIVWIGGTQADALRSGADSWLHWAVEAFGLQQLYAIPLVIALVFLVWSLLRLDDRPEDPTGVCLGMAIESLGFGLGLWALSRTIGPLLDVLFGGLQMPPSGVDAATQIVTFVGAGIYEELLFRLVLFSSLVALLRWLQAPRLVSLPVAAILSALLFAAAHHAGPYGEPFDEYTFIFRAVAGLYFAVVFYSRGFGIAVGAHALYDVLVGC
jgi:membrane protease YdiL (CAAX protease family)